MRSLVTAVISPRRFVGEASRGQSKGMDSLGALCPLPCPATKLAGCGTASGNSLVNAAAPNLGARPVACCHLRPPSHRRMHDGIADRGLHSCQLRTVPAVPASVVFEDCCMPTNSISAERLTKDRICPMQHTFVVLVIPSASPDRERPAYTTATSGHFPIVHLSFCDPFLF
jgi:hypothetical protein